MGDGGGRAAGEPVERVEREQATTYEGRAPLWKVHLELLSKDAEAASLNADEQRRRR